jgi:DNA-binding MarR family transcriptional regulator
MASRLRETELRAWQALLHAHHEVTSRLEEELKTEFGLSMADYDVLLRLARAGDVGLRMTQLAERVLMSPSGLTRVIDRLVSKGLVRRERMKDDARAMLVRLTERGRKRLRRAAATHLRGIRQHFTGRLKDWQLRQVAAALEVLTGPHLPH